MKKGVIDFPLIPLVAIIFGLILLAPVLLKLFVSMRDSFGAGVGNISNGGAIAVTNFNAVMNPLITFWDKIIIAAFVLAVLLLLVSSFFIDTHPVWLILYIFIWFLVILFAPNIIQSLDVLYASASFASEVAQLSFVDTLRTHFAEFLVGTGLISGIIIYAKMRFFGGTGGERR